MTALIVNLVLILAVLVLLLIWAISAGRRRRHESHRHAEERRLILQAFTTGAAQPSGPPATASPAPPSSTAGPPSTPAPAPPLDAESIGALLDLLDDRREPRRGLLSSLVTSPRSVWTAGTNAGRQVGRRTMGETRPAHEHGGDLYRDAALELVDIHSTEPRAAQREYQAYAAALGDPAIAQLYLRSAAYSAHPDANDARQVVEEITGHSQLEELSDGAASIES